MRAHIIRPDALQQRSQRHTSPQGAHGPETQRHVIQQLHPHIQFEPGRGRHEEAVVVGVDVEGPDRGQELRAKRLRIEDGDKVDAWAKSTFSGLVVLR